MGAPDDEANPAESPKRPIRATPADVPPVTEPSPTTAVDPAGGEPTAVDAAGADPAPVDPDATAAWPAWPTPGAGTPGPTRAASPSAWPASPPPIEPLPPAGAGADGRAPSPAPSARRSALLGAVAGAVVAAIVSTGISVALDDDPPQTNRGPVATPVTTSEGALDIQAILAKVQPSVVAIETSQTTSRGVFEGAGSGVVLSKDGLVLTNAHVIGNLGELTVVLADGERKDATLVGASPEDDLAVIRVEGVDDLVPAELGSSDDLVVGDEVIAIGNALNLGADPTVTRGIVSAKDRDLAAEGVELEGLIQTDAAINPGNSGGPLVNAAGQVVGVNTAIVADAQNLGFSIAIDRARPIIEDLQSGRGRVTPDQAFLGVSSTDLDGVTEAVRDRYGVEVEEGAFVTEVVPGSAADDAGIEVGDVIIEVDEAAVTESEDVRDAVIANDPGDEIDITVVRDGDEETFTVTLGRRGDA